MSSRMTAYEKQAAAALRAWAAEPPPLAARWTGRAAGPAGKAVEAAVPGSLLRAVLKGLDRAADRFSGHAALLRAAGVDRAEALRDEASLETCDGLAARVQRRAMVLAGGTGAVLGIAGVAGLVADVPTLIAQALRAVRRIAFCYGEAVTPAELRRLSIGVFALASATSMEEKDAALAALRDGTLALEHAGVRESMERAAQRELAKEAAVLSITNVARSVGRNLGWRRMAAGSLPGL
ncbi:MAG TPA: EcsC family protein, partial [Nevskiaceae bacterium]|nr:EcsC family protein [Nevskiaceae bacterium]